MRRAYGYLRVSGQSQLAGHGFPRQREAIQTWAKRTRTDIVRWFEEQAIPGETEELDRPAFTNMMRAAGSDGIHTVLVERLDRLARAYRIQEQILVYLASKGITLISADTGEDVTAAIQADPMKKALIQIQGVFAELDKSMLVRKLRAARERKRAQEGRCEGRKPYGSASEELRVIGIIKGLRRKPRGRGEPMSFNQIARKLNEAGIKTRCGGQWHAAQVIHVARGCFWGRARVERLDTRAWRT